MKANNVQSLLHVSLIVLIDVSHKKTVWLLGLDFFMLFLFAISNVSPTGRDVGVGGEIMPK